MAATGIKQRRPVRLLRRFVLMSFAALLFLVAVHIGIYFIFGIESYFAPYPAIDTKFPSGYSEVGFDQIQIGDTQERVRELIGEPLERCPMGRSSDSFWCYSDDGGFCCWDFAWLYRGVAFDDKGRVSNIYRDIYYD